MNAGKPTGIALDAMAAMLPHMETILRSDDYRALKERVQREGANLTVSDIMGDAFSAVAVKNRPALYGIVAAVTGKTVEEIDAQPVEETLEAFRGAMGSQVLDFFSFCARLAVRL